MLQGLYRTSLKPEPPRTFDAAFYVAKNPGLGLSEDAAYDHYSKFGIFEGRRPFETFAPTTLLSEKGRAVYTKLQPFVNRHYYISQTNLSDEDDLDVLLHYFAWGHDQNFSVSRKFDGAFYLAMNRDVREKNIDPLTHYCEFGHLEGRRSSAQHQLIESPKLDVLRADKLRRFIDKSYYLAQYPSLLDTDVDIALHYIKYGEVNGLTPNALFDARTYMERMGFSASPRKTALEKFIETGGDLSFALGRSYGGQTAPVLMPEVLKSEDWVRVRDEVGFDAALVQLRTPSQPLQNASLLSSAEQEGFNADESLDKNFVARAAKMAKDQQLSLDVWDTILRRDAAPDAIKLRLARYLWLTEWSRFHLALPLNHVDIFHARRGAEALAADSQFEYRFRHAAKEWLDLLQLPATADAVDTLLAKEVEIEKSAISYDPTIGELISTYNQPYVVISDFYHSSATLGELLRHVGAPEPKKIYASADHMETKRVGGLFDLVAEKEEVEAAKFLHIGDRKAADCEIPREHGYQALHYHNPDYERRNKSLDKTFWSYVAGHRNAHAPALAALVGDAAQPGRVSIESLGIVVAGFMLETLEAAKKVGAETVFFFSREGLFFQKVYDALVAEDVYDLGNYPAAKPLFVSRRATFAASLDEPDTENLMRLWTQYSSQSLNALLTTLNCDPTEFEEAAKACGFALDEKIVYPWQNKNFVKFLQQPMVRESLRQSCWTQRDNLIEYLDVAGFEPNSDKPRCIVDIGWRGTIQDNIALITRGQTVGCYLGLDKFLNNQPASSKKLGYLFDLNESDDRVVQENAAIEFIFNVTGGSVTGYQAGEPIREVIEGEEKTVVDFVVPLQARILKAVSEVARYVRAHGLVADDLRDLSRLIVKRYMTEPPSEAADAFKQLEHNETFGTGEADKIEDGGAGLFEGLSLDGEKLHYQLRQSIVGMRWHESLAFQSDVAKLTGSLHIDKSLHMPTVVFTPPEIRRRLAQKGTDLIFAVPEPIVGSGGHRTIFNAANRLAELGVRVRMMCEHLSTEEQRNWVSSILHKDVTLVDHWFAGFDCDLAVATVDYSAAYVNETFSNRSKSVYFIQDFEAQFNPVSDAYLRAERSYTMTDHHFSIGRWLAHRLKQEYGIPVASGGLGIEPSIYKVDETEKRRDRVAFLFQPEKFRRAPELCIEALRLLKERLPSVEVVAYGANTEFPFPFDCTQMGLITDLREIAKLYNTAKVGLCISATNPSRIPYEMMACGCVPVDVYRYNNLFDYGGDAGVLAYQSAESLAEAMAQMFEDKDAFAARQQGGFDFTEGRTIEWERDVFANYVSDIIEGRDVQGISAPRPQYERAPVIAEKDDTKLVRAFLKRQWALASETN